MNHSEHVDCGPLTALIGTWQGEKGADESPEPDGTEHNSYYERLTITPVRDVTNAECQVLNAVHYLQQVFRKGDDKPIHHETGYWLWDAENQQVINSLTIPRGLTLLAGGKFQATDNGGEFEVSASADDATWPITQTPFMQSNALTKQFSRQLQVNGNTLAYQQQMALEIYGRAFEHTDQNILQRQ